ncbi:hypothetical protein V8E36_001336 [Tilletia maclaganii]
MDELQTSARDGPAVLRAPEDLSIQLNACELLLSMWGGDDGFELGEQTQTGITDLAKYLALPIAELGSAQSHQLKDRLPAAIVFSLPVNATNLAERTDKTRKLQVEVALSLRKTAKSSLQPSIQIQRPLWLTRAQYDALVLNAGLSEEKVVPSEDDQQEDPASYVLSVIERISEAVLDLDEQVSASSSSNAGPAALDASSKYVVRAWYHFPSLSSKDKRLDLVMYAAHHTPPLTGFILAGKPGVAVLEAPLPGRVADQAPASADVTAATIAIDAYWSKIKSQSWSDIPPGHKKVSLRLTEDSADTRRVFAEMDDVTDSEPLAAGQTVRAHRPNRNDLTGYDCCKMHHDEAVKVAAHAEERKSDSGRFNGALTRLVMPLLRAVRRPYHLYPIGVLFGLGFDTASTITLLSVAAVAQRSSQDVEMDPEIMASSSRGNGRVIMLALLFTAGMTLVDSCDSVIMMVAYTRLGRSASGTVEEDQEPHQSIQVESEKDASKSEGGNILLDDSAAKREDEDKDCTVPGATPAQPESDTLPTVKAHHTSTLAPTISFYLTLLSVLLAFSICIIVVFSVAAEQCQSCADAASVEPASERSLSGRWWAFWASAGEQSGYIGAGIVGFFVLITAVWWAGTALLSWRRNRRESKSSGDLQAPRPVPLSERIRIFSRKALQFRQRRPRRGFTLLGQSVLLIGAEILANAAVWAITAIVFITSSRRSDLALAVLAWSAGLRHGLDSDHISAIDNSIRRFLALDQQDPLSANLRDLPVAELESQAPATEEKNRHRIRWRAFVNGFHAPILTGLYFSLGHSTIVIIATIIIAITTSALSGLQAFGDGPGGYVGSVVSATFLFIVGLLNSILLWRAWRARMRLERELREDSSLEQ